MYPCGGVGVCRPPFAKTAGQGGSLQEIARAKTCRRQRSLPAGLPHDESPKMRACTGSGYPAKDSRYARAKDACRSGHPFRRTWRPSRHSACYPAAENPTRVKAGPAYRTPEEFRAARPAPEADEHTTESGYASATVRCSRSPGYGRRRGPEGHPASRPAQDLLAFGRVFPLADTILQKPESLSEERFPESMQANSLRSPCKYPGGHRSRLSNCRREPPIFCASFHKCPDFQKQISSL